MTLTREQIEEWRKDAPATRQMMSSEDFRAEQEQDAQRKVGGNLATPNAHHASPTTPATAREPAQKECCMNSCELTGNCLFPDQCGPNGFIHNPKHRRTPA